MAMNGSSNNVSNDDDTKNNNTGGISTNIYFSLYNGTGLPWQLTVLIFVRWLIAIIGALLNACLFFVTLRTRFLFGSCNFLIGFNALCAALGSPFFTIGLVIALIKINFIPIWDCFWLQLLPMFVGNLFMISMLVIGIDRLLCIIFSIWHSKLNVPIYLATFLALSFAYSFFMVYLAYIGVQANGNLLVLCANPGEVYQGEIGDILFRMNLATISLTILAYLLLWFLLRRDQAAVSGTFTKKIMKSLVCILSVIIIGYFTSVSSKIVIRLFAPYIPMSPSQIVYFTFSTSILSTIAKGLNAPILFLFSRDYRAAFCKQFPRIFPSNSVHATSNMVFTKAQVPKGGTMATVVGIAHHGMA